MIRFLSILSACFALLILPATNAAPTPDKPKLIVGGDRDCPPYEFLENGKPTGFDIEMMRAVAEVTGFDVEFRLGPWSKVRQNLEQGRIDALAGMYYSPERSKLVDFSVPHTMVSSAIFVRKGSPIRSFADIRGKEVIVQEGDVLHDFLRLNDFTSHIVTVTDIGEELRLLSSGKHDCAIMPSKLQGEYFARKLGLANLQVINTDLPQLRYCFAVHKGNRELLYRLDEGLKILKVTGRYQEIYERWFGVYEKRDLWATIKYFVLALALIASLFIASLLWSWSLRRQVELRTAELRKSEEELRRAHTELERRVEERTAELKAANDQLRVSEAEKSLILNSTTDMVAYHDPDMKILWANWKAAVEANMPLEELAGRHCWDVFRKRSEPCEGCPVVLARDTGEPQEGEMCAPEGRTLFMRANPIKSDQGRLLGIAEFVLDISERKMAEEQLQLKKQQLEALNSTLEKRVREEVAKNREKDIILIQQNRQAALGEMLEHIAHQWKQPLNAISIIIQDLEDTYSHGELTSESVRDTVGKTMALLEHMAQTIHVFRDFYVPEKEKTAFRIKDSVDKALAFIAPALRFHSIKVELDVDPGLSAIGYPNEYAQVLLNIFANARDAFMERKVENPLVRVRAFAEDNKAVVTIADNAGGIPETIIDKIFDLYFSTRESSGGTGLGLYMSKNIIEKNMEGTLNAANVDRGAQFRIEVRGQV